MINIDEEAAQKQIEKAFINKEEAIHALITTSMFCAVSLETLTRFIKKIDEINNMTSCDNLRLITGSD